MRITIEAPSQIAASQSQQQQHTGATINGESLQPGQTSDGFGALSLEGDATSAAEESSLQGTGAVSFSDSPTEIAGATTAAQPTDDPHGFGAVAMGELQATDMSAAPDSTEGYGGVSFEQ